MADAAGHTCVQHSDLALRDWASSADTGVCPGCGQLIERASGCNHMQCPCGQSFCWACGAASRGGETSCGCQLYSRRFFAAVGRDVAGEPPLSLLAAALAFRDCVAVAQAVPLRYLPFAMAAPLVPAVVLLPGWYRVSAAWLLVASTADGLLPPAQWSFAVTLGMATTQWARSQRSPRAFNGSNWASEELKQKLRSLPLAVISAAPGCLVCVVLMATKACAKLEGTFAPFETPEGASATLAFLPLAIAAWALAFCFLHIAFTIPFYGFGINTHEDAQEAPAHALFGCLQTVFLQVAAWRLAPWWLGGAFQWALVPATLFWYFTVATVIVDGLVPFRIAFAMLVRDLGGPCAAAAQALAWCAMFCLQRSLHWLLGAALWAFCGQRLWAFCGQRSGFRGAVAGGALGLVAWAGTAVAPGAEAVAMASVGALAVPGPTWRAERPWVQRAKR